MLFQILIITLCLLFAWHSCHSNCGISTELRTGETSLNMPQISDSDLPADQTVDTAAAQKQTQTQIGACPDCYFTILILSAPGYRDRRDAVRSSYLSRATGRFNYVFLVGRGEGIEEEVEEKGDLLIYPKTDSYQLLTDKTLWGFRQVLERTTSQALLKTDDDSYINTTNLLALRERVRFGEVDFVGGVLRHITKLAAEFTNFGEVFSDFTVQVIHVTSPCPEYLI